MDMVLDKVCQEETKHKTDMVLDKVCQEETWIRKVEISIKLNLPNHFTKLIKVNKQMAEIILQNNIHWDRALIKQVQPYKRDGTIPRLADRNFREIALAVTLKAGKITFANKGTVYEILPYKDIGEHLDSRHWLSMAQIVSTDAYRP